jgi:8-oxo-dGTP pyrophosphatase MutT (NUDIX family)
LIPAHTRVADAAAAAIRLSDGRYLMQLRDQRPDIWYPDHWGFFGGSLDGGETPLQALCRELAEELELHIRDARQIARIDFDFEPLGIGKASRIYFLVELPVEALSTLVLHEGQRMAAQSYEQLCGGIRVVPYDAFALHLIHNPFTV